ncbi:MAG TPA: thioredoxin domain-containing protein, partial [Myxococcaceae bacterium]|nr:thioredoxin domain-containing protein [Myxococcaceae bacterium]
MKPNVIVALLVGLVLGFAFGKAVSGSSGGPASLTGRLLQPTGPAMTDETSLAVKSTQMPPGTFANMTDAQKVAVMRVMNEHDCDCGCGLGSLAVCITKDPNCPNSPGKLKQLVALAKQGKSYEQMTAEMFGPGAAKPKPTRPQDDMTTVFKVPLEDSPALGKTSAPITLVEISDYQCPYCGRANATIQQLQKDYGDKLRLVMKENPLDSIHPFARGAAKAALAAGVQGKYWPMHDKLFENQRSLDQASLEKYAAELGLNVDRFKKDQNDPKWDQVIARDQGLAQQLQATSTPQFFVNGRHISGARELNVFKGIIDEELTKVDAMLKSGVKPEQVYAKLMEQAASGPSAAPAAAAPAAPAVKKVPVPDDAPFFGPKNAKVTIVEFSDFECPFCQRAVAPLHQVKDAYPKDVKVVFRQFPLPATMHPHAMGAAEAALAAHEQGKFWQMHDKLFDNRSALNRPDLEKYAQEIGLDMNKFKAALDGGKFKAKIAEDQSAGGAVGVGGTPTFFIDGQVQVGALSFEQWKAKIDEEIKKADKLLASGVKPDKLYEKMLDAAPAPAVAANTPPPAPGAAAPSGPVKDVTVGSAPVRGPKGAPVTIVEYSDFQCPFCSRAVEVIKQLDASYKDKFRIAYKHQPLQQLHPNAQLAAEAAMAAHEQGKFWEYHDKLFGNQQGLDRASLEKYAQELQLDMGKFKAALDQHKFKPAIDESLAYGAKSGARGTPTFFVNGKLVRGAQPF